MQQQKQLAGIISSLHSALMSIYQLFAHSKGCDGFIFIVKILSFLILYSAWHFRGTLSMQYSSCDAALHESMQFRRCWWVVSLPSIKWIYACNIEDDCNNFFHEKWISMCTSHQIEWVNREIICLFVDDFFGLGWNSQNLKLILGIFSIKKNLNTWV